MYNVTMRTTFVTRKFGNVEHNSHCDVLHITPIRVARLFLDCNGDFAIKAYANESSRICPFLAVRPQYTFSANVRHLSELSETKVLGRFCGRPIC